ncbi:MAG: hypothetical protein R3F20_09180, partial [Planctomycetota bacterium]
MQKLALIALATILVGGLASGQMTIYVDAAATPGGNGTVGSPFALIQDGIDAAIDGDTVQVAPGTYLESLDFLGKRIAVVGTGADITTIDGSTLSAPVVTMDNGEGAGTFLKGFTITGGTGVNPNPSAPGASSAAGGIYISRGGIPTTPLTLDPVSICNCRISGNNAGSGGGILLVGWTADLVVSNCEISGNSATFAGTPGNGGGIEAAGIYLRVERTSISGNSAALGGGIHCQGQGILEIVDCEISSNVAFHPSPAWAANGGGLAGVAGKLTLSRTRISSNMAEGAYGGLGLFVSGSGAVIDRFFMEECEIVGNIAEFLAAGAVTAQGRITSSTISANISSSTGVAGATGFVFSPLTAATLSIDNSIIRGNTIGDLAVFPSAS